MNKENIENQEEIEEEKAKVQAMSSRVEVDDSKIPPFLRKIKNKRF